MKFRVKIEICIDTEDYCKVPETEKGVTQLVLELLKLGEIIPKLSEIEATPLLTAK